MNESAAEAGGEMNPHLDQGIPREWATWEVGGEQVIAYDVPEGSLRLYRVVSASHVVRSFASADAALYWGRIVDTHYDASTKQLEFIHEYAGRKGSHRVEDFLEQPALRLDELEQADQPELLS